jgi:hypothetical protein
MSRFVVDGSILETSWATEAALAGRREEFEAAGAPNPTIEIETDEYGASRVRMIFIIEAEDHDAAIARGKEVLAQVAHDYWWGMSAVLPALPPVSS